MVLAIYPCNIIASSNGMTLQLGKALLESCESGMVAEIGKQLASDTKLRGMSLISRTDWQRVQKKKIVAFEGINGYA